MKFYLSTIFKGRFYMSKDVKLTQVPLLGPEIFAERNHIATFDALVVPLRDVERSALADQSNLTVPFIDLYGLYLARAGKGRAGRQS